MPVERIQAPYGGINSDASPDYVGATEAPAMQNFLPGFPGKLMMRGPINRFVQVGVLASDLVTNWVFDDSLIMKVHNASAGTKYWKIVGGVVTDVTATLTSLPSVNMSNTTSAVRFGNFVYGSIFDGTNLVAMGKWDGTSTITAQTNAPYRFYALRVFTHRMFVLGGTVPGLSPVGSTNEFAHKLYWTDPDATDLSPLATWQDDVSGLTNQIAYDETDTPIGLALCGRSLAILGSRSINLLTGDGPTNYALRNVTREFGCVSADSVIEASNGFYFMSDRGFCFCDGTTVQLVSGNLTLTWLAALTDTTTRYRTAMATNGNILIGIQSSFAVNGLWLYHTDTGSWTQITGAVFQGGGTFELFPIRTLNQQFVWDGLYLCTTQTMTNPTFLAGQNGDFAATTTFIPCSVTTRLTRLAAPSSMATINRVIVEYAFPTSNSIAARAFVVTVLDGQGNTLVSTALPPLVGTYRRQFAVIDVNGEADTVQLKIEYTGSGVGSENTYLDAPEVYDAYVEFDAARNAGSR